MGYDGFISYSHAADRRLAPALQSGLQRLAKPWYRLRALRVFRDDTSLATNPHLWSSIVEALDESEWFVLLASPEAAASSWVEKEITHWLETKSAARILPVLTGGDWAWDAQSSQLVGNAVPDVLRRALREEPRHLDLRWAASDTDLDLHNGSFRSAIADLAAPMHGVPKDELEGEDIRQHRRARRLARLGVTTVVALMIVSVIFAGYAVTQRNKATTNARRLGRERDRANANAATAQHALLVSESQGLLGSDRQLATLLAIEADRREPNADSRGTLLNAALAEPALQRTFGNATNAIGGLVGHRVVLTRMSRGATPNRDIVQVWNWRTSHREPWPNAPLGDATTGPVCVATTADGQSFAVVTREGMIQLHSGRTLQPVGAPFAPGLRRLAIPAGTFDCIKFSADSRTLAVTLGAGPVNDAYPGSSISVFSRHGNRWLRDPTPAGQSTRVNAFDLSPDGRVIVTAAPALGGSDSDIVISDVATGRTITSFRGVGTGFIALDWARRRVVVTTSAVGPETRAVWYDLNGTIPVAHTIDLALSGVGRMPLAYDATRTRLGVDGINGFEVFDAATLTPVLDAPLLRPDTEQGPFLFLDAHDVAVGTNGAGPISVWDLTGTSALATVTPNEFDGGIEPTGDPNRYLGLTASGTATIPTLLDAKYRPLGAAFTDANVACLDPRTDRIATVSLQSGDVVIRDGTPPFRVQSRAPGVALHIADPLSCSWRPDGRQVAIATYPQTRAALPTSVALYDVATKSLRNTPIKGQIVVLSMLYSADSTSLFVGGPTNLATGLHEIVDLDGTPRISAPFASATAIDASANGRRYLVSYRSSLRVFDARSRRPVGAPIALPGKYIYGVTGTPGGRAATIDTPQGWQFVDLETQQLSGPVFAWSLPSSAYLSADGHTVYSLDASDQYVAWDLAPADVRAVACDLAGRNLTEQEWHHYLPWAGTRHATCSQYPLN